MENGWKMEDGKWKPETGFITFGVARKPWRGSPGGRPDEAAYPTLPASGHLARLALRGSTSVVQLPDCPSSRIIPVEHSE